MQASLLASMNDTWTNGFFLTYTVVKTTSVIVRYTFGMCILYLIFCVKCMETFSHPSLFFVRTQIMVYGVSDHNHTPICIIVCSKYRKPCDAYMPKHKWKRIFSLYVLFICMHIDRKWNINRPMKIIIHCKLFLSDYHNNWCHTNKSVPVSNFPVESASHIIIAQDFLP